MLLSQVASQLNTLHMDEFHKALFPSGNISKLSILNQTLAELGVTSAQPTEPQSLPIQPENPRPASETNQLPNVNLPGVDNKLSRQQKREAERIAKKVEKSKAKDEERKKMEKSSVIEKKEKINEIRRDVNLVNNERLARILGL
jgi:hypothetical protein